MTRPIIRGIIRTDTRAKAGSPPKRRLEAVRDACDYINAQSDESFDYEACCSDVVPVAIASCIALYCNPGEIWGNQSFHKTNDLGQVWKDNMGNLGKSVSAYEAVSGQISDRKIGNCENPGSIQRNYGNWK